MKFGNKGSPKYITGSDGYSGISVTLTAVSSDRTSISETVEVNNPVTPSALTISESVIVTVT